MKVQKVVKPDNQISWLVLDDKFKPVAPILEFTKFLEATDKSPNTIKAYSHHLKLYWQFLTQDDISWTDICIEDLANFIRWLQSGDQDGVISIVKRDAKRTNKTINLIMAAVSAFYDYHSRSGKAADLKIYRDGAFSGKYKSFLHHITSGKSIQSRVLKLKEPKRGLKTLTKPQVHQVIEACNNLRDKFIICLMYETGMRIGQVLGLRHEDIKSGDNQIVIRFRSNNENNARSKSREDNLVDVSSSIVSLYTDYFIHEYGEVESDYVFVNLWDGEIGAPMKYGSVITLFKRISKKTGIDVTPHIFRHTHATELLRAGWDLAYIQKRLGHSDIQTTANIYAHLSSDDMKKELAKFRGEQCH